MENISISLDELYNLSESEINEIEDMREKRNNNIHITETMEGFSAEVNDLDISFLDKERIIRPIEIPDAFGDLWLCCGNCNRPVITPFNTDKAERCIYCNVKIDWSVDNEVN